MLGVCRLTVSCSLSRQDLKRRNEVILEAKARLEDELENLQSKASLVGEWLRESRVHVHCTYCGFMLENGLIRQRLVI